MKGKLLLAICVLAAVVAVAIIISLFVPQNPPTPPVRPVPNPNGFDTLLRASQMLAPGTGDYPVLDEATLSPGVNANSNALYLARVGLQQECLLPSEPNAAFFAGSKKLANAFFAEGRLAEVQHRDTDAAKSYVEVVHLGIQSDRGGLLINGLAALAIEAIGTGNLRSLYARLDSKTCRETALTLEKLDVSREPWSKILQQEEAYLRRASLSLKDRAMLIWNSRSRKKTGQQSQAKVNDRILQTRRLILDLATRAYELDKGHRPMNASDLVPDYLKAIPQDPTTGTNLTLD